MTPLPAALCSTSLWVLLALAGCEGTGSVRISEVSCLDDDWVELWAPGAAVDLSGFVLSDGAASDRAPLPEGTRLPSGGRLVFYEDRDLDFGLRCGDETLSLYRPDGTLVDAATPPPLLPGQTWGLLPEGTDPDPPTLGLNRPTAGAPNEVTPLHPAPAAPTPPPANTAGPCAEASRTLGHLACAEAPVDAATLGALTIAADLAADYSPDVLRIGKLLLPTTDDPTLLPPLLQNAALYPLHQDFLLAAFPERFAGLDSAAYRALVLTPTTRRYLAATLWVLTDALGFSVLADPASTPDPELLLAAASRLESLLGAPVRWVPLSAPELAFAQTPAAAELAPRPLSPPAGAGTIVYTPGTAYGTVRLFTLDALAAASTAGELSWRDIVVVDGAPTDLETVVAAVVTAAPQTELGHLAIRAARRGTPNLYQQGASALFAPWEGRLVRLTALSGGWAVNPEVSLAEAEAAWAASRPELTLPTRPDLAWEALEPLDTLAVATEAERRNTRARYGQKATNLATLNTLLPAEERTLGLAIPFVWSGRFLDRNSIGGRTYREHIAWLASDPELSADPGRLRAELRAFQDEVSAHALLPDGLESELGQRIAEVFGGSEVMVRLRSSSNAEDLLGFSGAGLYTSRSACAADSLDGDEELPSRCDPNTGRERTLRDALVAVWASLYLPRAWDERAFYGLGHDPDEVAMAVLVTPRFTHEQASGVLLTGVPGEASPSGRRLVNAQWGEVPVVSPIPGTLPERVLLAPDAGGAHLRTAASNLIPPGYVVLPDPWLDQLAARARTVARDFPLDDVPADAREGVLIELEWKFDRDGRLVLKQARPIAPATAVAPDGLLLSVPGPLSLCSTAVDDRNVFRELELRTRLTLAPLGRLLPFDLGAYPQPLPWLSEIQHGRGSTPVQPAAAGTLDLSFAESFQQTWTFGWSQSLDDPAGPLQLSWEHRISAPQGQPPVGQLVQPSGERPGLSACVGACATAQDHIGLSACNLDHLPLWRHTLTLDAAAAPAAPPPFTTLTIDMRHREEPVESGPVRLLHAILTHADGSTTRVEGFFEMAYATQRHNRGESFLLHVGGPTPWLLIDEPDLLEGPTARVLALDEDLAPLPGDSVWTTTDWSRAQVSP